MKSLTIITVIMILSLLACQQDKGEKSSTASKPQAKPVEKILSGTVWLVEDIAGRGVIDNAQATIRFEADARVSGRTGCNRFNGTATIEGNKVTFGPLATTRRACVPALMDQEKRFLKAVGEVRSFTVDENGLLHLKDANSETLLRLSRLEDHNQ